MLAQPPEAEAIGWVFPRLLGAPIDPMHYARAAPVPQLASVDPSLNIVFEDLVFVAQLWMLGVCPASFCHFRTSTWPHLRRQPWGDSELRRATNLRINAQSTCRDIFSSRIIG